MSEAIRINAVELVSLPTGDQMEKKQTVFILPERWDHKENGDPLAILSADSV